MLHLELELKLLNVSIPPCYLSQNEDFELDVIDGQQRLFSIYRFLDNQYSLSDLEVLKELNGLRLHEIRGGPTCLDRMFQSLSGALRCSAYAAVRRVGRLPKYTPFGV